MNSQKKYVMTYTGIRKIEEELNILKTVKRNEIKERIKVALSFGDISENSEYDSAKNEQAFLEEKIAKIEDMLKQAEVVDESDILSDVVSIGCKVKVKDVDLNEIEIYNIVGSAEADPLNSMISHESPVGEALMGKAVGDKVTVNVPDGELILEVMEILK